MTAGTSDGHYSDREITDEDSALRGPSRGVLTDLEAYMVELGELSGRRSVHNALIRNGYSTFLLTHDPSQPLPLIPAMPPRPLPEPRPRRPRRRPAVTRHRLPPSAEAIGAGICAVWIVIIGEICWRIATSH